jgi:hypothetical protein
MVPRDQHHYPKISERESHGLASGSWIVMGELAIATVAGDDGLAPLRACAI